MRRLLRWYLVYGFLFMLWLFWGFLSVWGSEWFLFMWGLFYWFLFVWWLLPDWVLSAWGLSNRIIFFWGLPNWLPYRLRQRFFPRRLPTKRLILLPLPSWRSYHINLCTFTILISIWGAIIVDSLTTVVQLPTCINLIGLPINISQFTSFLTIFVNCRKAILIEMVIGFGMILVFTLYFITILILITITIIYTITIIIINIMTIIVIQSPILHIFTSISILLLQPNWPITIPSPLALALTIRLTHILPIIKLAKPLHPIVNIRSFILFIILFVSTTYVIIFTISLIWYP